MSKENETKPLKQPVVICCGVFERMEIGWMTLEDGTKCMPYIKGHSDENRYRVNNCPSCGKYVRDVMVEPKHMNSTHAQTSTSPAIVGIFALLPTVTSREGRIEIVNEIIKEIASRGLKFFAGKFGVAEIFQRNSRLYMKNEYNGTEMFLHTKFGYPPKRWHHGGTLWGLTKDFKDFIITGEKTNHNNGYGGLYSPHWGYTESDMRAIQERAKSLGYL